MKIKWIIFFLLTIGLASCASKRISVQVLKPAEVTLPRTAMRVGVMDRTFLAWAARPTVYENGEQTTRFKDLKTIGPKKVTEGFVVELNGFKRFTTIPVSSPEKVDSTSVLVPKISKETLDDLQKDSSIDILVSLEGYKANVSTDGNIYTSVFYDGFGNPYTVPRFQGRRTIKVTALWRIYDLKTKTILNERTLETELVFSANGYNPDESYRNLPEQKGSVENTSQVAGIDYAKTLVPFWQSSERMIYIGQTNAWLDAADSAEVGNWESAAEQWKLLEKKPSLPIIQKQAVFNLFTAYEVLGNFEESEHWAKYGQKKFKDRDFDAGILFLDKRRIENEQIDEQLNE